MKILLLAGYSDSSVNKSQKNNVDNKIWLDHQIECLRPLGYQITVVLGRSSSECLLRHSQQLSYHEIAFDTHGDHSNLITNIKAGLATTRDWCLVCPVEIPQYNLPKIRSLINSYYCHTFQEDLHILTSCPIADLPSPHAFPLLITRTGNHFIKTCHPDIEHLADSQIKYCHLADKMQVDFQ